MTFEMFKQLFIESIDEGNNMAEILSIVIEKVYQKGVKDGKKIEERK